jgi:hypothetical protein
LPETVTTPGQVSFQAGLISADETVVNVRGKPCVIGTSPRGAVRERLGKRILEILFCHRSVLTFLHGRRLRFSELFSEILQNLSEAAVRGLPVSKAGKVGNLFQSQLLLEAKAYQKPIGRGQASQSPHQSGVLLVACRKRFRVGSRVPEFPQQRRVLCDFGSFEWLEPRPSRAQEPELSRSQRAPDATEAVRQLLASKRRESWAQDE